MTKKIKCIFLVTLVLLLMMLSIKFNMSTKTHYKIGVYYVVCNQTFSQNWKRLVTKGMVYAIPRLNTFFSEKGIYWSYKLVAEVNIDYELRSRDEHGNLPSRLYKTVPLIIDNRPDFVSEYSQYDVVIILFGGDFVGAYSYDYHSPIYASEDLFRSESAYKTLIEHEILHTFGLGGHNSPLSKKYYRSCVMGSLILGRIQLCPECQEELIIPNKQFDLLELTSWR